jgi:hypothetical protein
MMNMSMNVVAPAATTATTAGYVSALFTLRWSASSFFQELCEAHQDDVQDTARFAGLYHVDVKTAEDLGVAPHRLAQRRTAFHVGHDFRDRILEELLLGLLRQDVQALHHGQAGVDHGRKLAREDADVLHRYAVLARHLEGELRTLLAHRGDDDLAFAQV